MFSEFSDYSDCEPAGVRLPKISLEKDVFVSLDLPEDSSPFEVLKALTRKGIIERGIDKFPNKKEYYDRAKYELDTFEELGFTSYVLLNWEIINFAKTELITVGEGRGSAASSLVLYLLNVTDKDPIKHDLFFERFVSKSRAKKIIDKNGEVFLDGSLVPDVDSDFAHEERDRVIKFIEEKHKGKTAKILTFNTFSSKLCIKEAVKYFNGASEEEAGAVSDLIQKKHGIVQSITDALEDNEKFQEWAQFNKNTVENANSKTNFG